MSCAYSSVYAGVAETPIFTGNRYFFRLCTSAARKHRKLAEIHAICQPRAAKNMVNIMQNCVPLLLSAS